MKYFVIILILIGFAGSAFASEPDIPPPLKQMKLGIKLGHIICDEDKIPTWNVHFKPACVYPESENKLLTRGWAKLRLMMPASGDPIKELEWTGKNELSYRFTGNLIVGDEKHPLSYDRKREIVWEYAQKYHPGERFLEYSITPDQYHYKVGEKIQFDLLEWGNFSECWNLNLRIFDNHNQVLHEETLNDVCLEPDGKPGTFNSYSIGKDAELVCKKPGYYLIEVSNGEIFPLTILQNFVCLDTEPELIPKDDVKSTQEHYEIEIIVLKDVYLVGERYDFSYILSGYGHPCGGKEVTFPDSNGDTITIASSASCIANLPMGIFVFDIQKEQGTTYGHVEIKNPGTYTVTVTFDKPSKYFPTTVSKEFRVVEK